jgi:hypothetical protein
MKHFPLPLTLLILSILSISPACHKPPPPKPDPPITDTVPKTDTTPPKKDTIQYVIRIEEDFLQSNPTIDRRNRDYSFYYDNDKRVTAVGIKNYDNVLYDTATCWLFYTGSAPKPRMIITPNFSVSSPGGTLYYDTTWFTYDNSNRILSDSGIEHANGLYPAITVNPLKRTWSYPDDTKTLITWYGVPAPGSPLQIIRKDSINAAAGEISNMRTQFYYGNGTRGNYASTESFLYSTYINPLSKLNISGTIFSLIYSPVKLEILGNSDHKAVSNTNILPYYLDFYSTQMPSGFYLGGFTSGDFLIGSTYDQFDIQITPGIKRPEYPSQISVGARTALDDRFIYRFYY